MKDYSVNEAAFTNIIKIVETTDPAHADNINYAVKQVFENTVANKQTVDKTVKNVDTKLTEGLQNLAAQNEATKKEIKAEQAELKKELAKAIKDIADSKGASKTTFNPDGSVTEENSLETVKTVFNADKSITERHEYKNGTVKVLKTVFQGNKVITTVEG